MLRFLVGGLLLTVAAFSQTPQVSINIDFWPSMRVDRAGDATFRWYDDLGHTSVVSVTLLTEVGFKAFVSERLQQIPGDADNEALNEYYVEDSNHWRVGKQLLPFGLTQLEREYVRAARVDTTLALGGWPLYIAACDGGVGKQKGVVGRLGEGIGVSIASGEHFGIAGSAFNEVRKPEDSPGIGAGYDQMFGLDFTQHVGRLTASGEAVRVRKGRTSKDQDNDFGLLKLEYEFMGDNRFSITWARDVASSVDSYRFRLESKINRNLDVFPQIRFRGGRFLEGFLGLRLRY